MYRRKWKCVIFKLPAVHYFSVKKLKFMCEDGLYFLFYKESSLLSQKVANESHDAVSTILTPEP